VRHILLIDCPDQRGIVAAVSDQLYRCGANILHADQHQDAAAKLFFMRVEWEGFDPLPQTFTALAERFGMRYRLERADARQRVAVFVSRRDHCLVDVLHRWRAGELACDVALVVSNHRDAEPLAEFYGVRFRHVPVVDRAAAEREQLGLLTEASIDLVVLARYMQILSPAFVAAHPQRIINVHHSFLPAFSGARPYHQAFERGVKLIGATSHYVTDALDDGPIIEQDVARISHRDQVADLARKGRDLETAVLARAVRWHLEHRILVYGKKTVVFD
jgi:formyltetrahydrofolate deformylase